MQIVYFPYLFMKDLEEVDFGFAKVWNFEKKKDEYVSDEKVKAKLELIFSTYVTYDRPIKGIAIISIGDIDFREFNQTDELEIVRQVRILLFLSLLSENNTLRASPNAHDAITSENVDIIFQNFVLDNDFTAERSGEIISYQRGGYKLSEIKYQTPGYVPTLSRFRIDNELLSLLIKLRLAKPVIFRRIRNASEIFLESYYNSSHLSRNARILLMCSAFEILLSLDAKEPRKDFKAKIESIAALPQETTYESHWSRHERRPNQARERFTLKGLWAESFYMLRNSIIHGDSPSSDKFAFRKQQSYIYSSTLFFVLSIRKQLEKSLRSYQCDYEITWESWTDDISQATPVQVQGFQYKRSWRRKWAKYFSSPKKKC